MEPEGSLPYSQAPATYPYPKPDQSTPSSPSNVLKTHFNKPHLRLGLPSGLLPSGLPTKTPFAPLRSHIRAEERTRSIFTGTHVYAGGD